MSLPGAFNEFHSAAANELADLMAAAEPRRVCIGCGCTDGDACTDPVTGEPCHWVAGYSDDICSLCEIAAAVARVELYSPHEAQRYIEASRGARI